MVRLTGKETPGVWPLDGEYQCAICGKEPVAMWRGALALYICGHCAREVLPRLIADALTPDYAEYGKILDAFKALEIPYLQAALCIIAQRRS